MILTLLGGSDYCISRPQETKGSRALLHGVVDPTAISCAPSGAMFILDRGSSEILRYTVDGTVSARAGGFGGGEDGFDSPTDINAVSDLQVLVADYGNNRLVLYDAALNRTEIISADGNGTGDRLFGYPRSAAVDRYGAVYIIDGENIRIVKIDRMRKLERTFGGAEAGKGRLKKPTRIRIGDDDRVYVVDGSHIVTFDVFGNFLQTHALADTGKSIFLLVGTDGFVAADDTLRSLQGDRAIALRGNERVGVIRDIAWSGGRIFVLGDSTVYRFPFPGREDGK